MSKRKNLVLLLSGFHETVFNKDVFLVPYYLGKLYDLSASIVFNWNSGSKEMPEECRGVKLRVLSGKGRNYGDAFLFSAEWRFFLYILKHAREIDILMRFHFSYQTMIIGWIYKWRNPSGCFYIKGDGLGVYGALLRNEDRFAIRWKNKIIRMLCNHMCSIADKVSIELPDLYDFLKEQKPFKAKPQKLVLMLNGFDEELFEEYQMKEIPVPEKENIILSVGRHGSEQKNTECFLRALTHVDLKDWKVVFVGTVEPDFREKELSDFYHKNPHLKEQVRFIGPIYDQKSLWNRYNRAKVFVHTARFESYGIVLGEAFRFNDYIVSTDVGIAKYVIEKGMGKLFPQNDDVSLGNILQSIVDGKTDVCAKFESKNIDNRSISMSGEIAKLSLF